MANFTETLGYSFKNKGLSNFQFSTDLTRLFIKINNSSGSDGVDLPYMGNIIGVGRQGDNKFSITRLEATTELVTKLSTLQRISIPYEGTTGGNFTLRTKATIDGKLGVSIKGYESNGYIFHYNEEIDKFDDVELGIISDNDATFIMETTGSVPFEPTNLTGLPTPYYFYADYYNSATIRLGIRNGNLDLDYKTAFTASAIIVSNNYGYIPNNTTVPSTIVKFNFSDKQTADKVEELSRDFSELEQTVEQTVNDINDISNATREYYVSR